MIIIQEALHDIAQSQLQSQALIDFDNGDIDIAEEIETNIINEPMET